MLLKWTEYIKSSNQQLVITWLHSIELYWSYSEAADSNYGGRVIKLIFYVIGIDFGWCLSCIQVTRHVFIPTTEMLHDYILVNML